MHVFNHRFTVNAALPDVLAFHRQSRSMGAITPPPIIARIQRAPVVLGEGDEMSFTLWMGFLPIRWRARIENVSDRGFTDRQLSGPFHTWVHQHVFEPVTEDTTAVIDTVTCEFHEQFFWRFVGVNMWLGMRLLFAYRGWKTKRIFENAALQTSANL